MQTEAHIFKCHSHISGGELFDRLKKTPKKRFDEETAKLYMRQVVQAVAYVHGMGICHRDLKLENFLCESQENYKHIKLIDFGLSKKYSDMMRMEKKGGDDQGDTNVVSMTSMVGTPYYMAPEIFGDKGYDVACDMWGGKIINSINIINRMYNMLVMTLSPSSIIT